MPTNTIGPNGPDPNRRDTDGRETEGARQDGAARSTEVLQGFSLILASTLMVIGLMILTPIMPQLRAAFRDVPNAGFGVPALISAAGLGAAVFAPFAGEIGDRFGRSRPLVLFCLAFSAFGALPLLIDDFTLILASRVAVGISYMGILVLSTAMIGDRFVGDSRNRWLGGQAIVATTAALLLLPLGGALGTWFGWRGPFLVYLVGIPFAFAYARLFPHPGAIASAAQPHVGWGQLPWHWLAKICAISIFGGMLAFSLQLQIGVALAAIGVDDSARIGLLSGLIFVGFPIGSLLFIKFGSWPFERLVPLGLSLLGVTLMALRHASDTRLFIAVAFANVVAAGMVLPKFLTHVAEHLDAAVRARGIGVWQATLPLGQFLAVGICSLAMEILGVSILDSFWLLGATGVAASVLGWLLAVMRRRPAPGAEEAGAPLA